MSSSRSCPAAGLSTVGCRKQAGCCADYELHEHDGLLEHQARDTHTTASSQQARSDQRQSLTSPGSRGSRQGTGSGMARSPTTCAWQQAPMTTFTSCKSGRVQKPSGLGNANIHRADCWGWQPNTIRHAAIIHIHTWTVGF